MKVVLREDVEKLGLRGEVVDVARGYARNFLLPRNLAEPATPARVAELEKVNARRARHEAQSFEQAQEIAQRLGQAEIRFDVKAGETGVLFGSVTQTNLADMIWEKLKVRVDRRKIDLPDSRAERFHRSFLRSVRRNGRVYELGMMVAYKLRSRDFLGDAEKTGQMLAKGKLSLLPHRSGGAAEVRELFRRAEEEEKKR